MVSYIVFPLFASVLEFTQGQVTSYLYELYSTNEINGNEIFTFNHISVQKCIFICDETYGCLSVNFHKGNKTCVLTDYYPTDVTKTPISEAGWNIFFRRHFDIDVLNGAEAWQSSTLFHVGSLLTADKAIDGDTNNNANQNVCAHTNNSGSYWAVTFGTYGPVKKVKIYLRSDGFYGIVQTITVNVCNTRDDVINDNGIHCGSFTHSYNYGQPSTVTVTCTNTVYGRFLQIKTDWDYLVLCEVFVYPPK